MTVEPSKRSVTLSLTPDSNAVKAQIVSYNNSLRLAVAVQRTAVASRLPMAATTVEIEVAGLCFVAVQLFLCALGDDEGVLVLDSSTGHVKNL